MLLRKNKTLKLCSPGLARAQARPWQEPAAQKPTACDARAAGVHRNRGPPQLPPRRGQALGIGRAGRKPLSRGLGCSGGSGQEDVYLEEVRTSAGVWLFMARKPTGKGSPAGLSGGPCG